MHANIGVWTDTHMLEHVHMQAHTVVGEHLEYIFGCNKYIEGLLVFYSKLTSLQDQVGPT